MKLKIFQLNQPKTGIKAHLIYFKLSFQYFTCGLNCYKRTYTVLCISTSVSETGFPDFVCFKINIDDTGRGLCSDPIAVTFIKIKTKILM